MKSVALVTESYPPTRNGVSNSVYQVARELSELGTRVLVIAPAVGRASASEREPWGAEIRRIASLPLAKSGFRIGIPSPEVFQLLRDFRPDVVHAASPIGLGAHAITQARRLALPSVAVYQTDVASFMPSYGIVGSSAVWSHIRRIHNRATLTLAPSTASMRDLQDHGIERIYRWGRGVDAQLYDPAKRTEAKRSQLAPNGEVLIGYVGRLAPEKEVGMLSALRDIPGTRIVVVGKGSRQKELASTLPDAAFLGELHGEELAEAYACLDVFVHPGRRETFCQAVQEAQASGDAVIAPNAGGPIDLVEHNKTGFLFAPGLRTELRKFVEYLVDNPDVRQQFGAAGRRRAEVHTWPHVTQDLIGHYQNALEMGVVCSPAYDLARQRVDNAIDAGHFHPRPTREPRQRNFFYTALTALPLRGRSAVMRTIRDCRDARTPQERVAALTRLSHETTRMHFKHMTALGIGVGLATRAARSPRSTLNTATCLYNASGSALLATLIVRQEQVRRRLIEDVLTVDPSEPVPARQALENQPTTAENVLTGTLMLGAVVSGLACHRRLRARDTGHSISDAHLAIGS